MLNLPPEYAFIVSRLNAEDDNGVEFALLENGANVPASAMENLDLYGATMMDRYNKLFNF